MLSDIFRGKRKGALGTNGFSDSKHAALENLKMRSLILKISLDITLSQIS